MREILLQQFYRKMGYTFHNPQLLEHALTHRSREGVPSNERLEFLGDSVLNLVMTEALYQRFSDCHEGDLSRLRASLVKGETLSKMALELDLGEMMHFGLGELNTGGDRRHSTLEDAFEAVIGAIYLDSDFETVKSLINDWFKTRFDEIDANEIPRDYKSALQEHLQSEGLALPSYEILRAEGPDHAKTFYITCTVSSLSLVETAQGHSRKMAEQAAAQKILEMLKHAA